MKSIKRSNITSLVTFGNQNASNILHLKKFTKNDLERACRKKIIRPFLSTKEELQVPKMNGSKEGEEQLISLDKSVQVCARKFNECKSKADRLEEQVSKKRDEMSELQREKESLDQMILGKNNDANVITDLNEELKTAIASSEKKLHYRMQLNYMHVRQMNISASTDETLNNLSHELKTAEANKLKYQKMLNDIESSLTSCSQTNEDFAKRVDLERSNRMRDITVKRLEASNAERIERWRSSREATSQDLEVELSGSAHVDNELLIQRIQELEKELGDQSRRNGITQKDYESSKSIISSIQKATGVNNFFELVDKFTRRQEEIERMANEKTLAESRQDSITRALKNVQDSYRQLKSMDATNKDLTLDNLQAVQVDIDAEHIGNKVLKSNNEQLGAILLVLRQGVSGLYQRLLPFQPTVSGIRESDSPIDQNKPPTDEIEMLNVVGDIVEKMKYIVCTLKDDISSHVAYEDSIMKLQNPNLLGATNCRIQAKESLTHMVDSTDDLEDNEGDEMTRRGIKMLSFKTPAMS